MDKENRRMLHIDIVIVVGDSHMKDKVDLPLGQLTVVICFGYGVHCKEKSGKH